MLPVAEDTFVEFNVLRNNSIGAVARSRGLVAIGLIVEGVGEGVGCWGCAALARTLTRTIVKRSCRFMGRFKPQ